ncbi:P1 family peptidase [Sorangium cellulosum]|uniref:P1 family peptidase n=1 Tax=Sorangium cellulosum TaxID=56 RepID=UPI003D9C49CC
MPRRRPLTADAVLAAALLSSLGLLSCAGPCPQPSRPSPPAAHPSLPARPPAPPPTARAAAPKALGIVIGRLPTGTLNAVTDVPGVRVGHVTHHRGAGRLDPGKGPVRTGVTVILPTSDDFWHNKRVGKSSRSAARGSVARQSERVGPRAS